MFKRCVLAIGVLLLAVACVATVASARESAKKPNLAKLVLRQSDIPGSTIIRQGYVKDPDYAATYEREFEGGRFQSIRLANVESDVSLAKTLTDARMEMVTMQAMATGPSGRRAFESIMREAIAAETGPTGEKVLSVRGLRARNVRLGDGGYEIAFVMRVTGGELGKLIKPMQMSITGFRVDRILGSLFVMSQPGGTLPPGIVVNLGKTFAARVMTGLNSDV